MSLVTEKLKKWPLWLKWGVILVLLNALLQFLVIPATLFLFGFGMESPDWAFSMLNISFTILRPFQGVFGFRLQSCFNGEEIDWSLSPFCNFWHGPFVFIDGPLSYFVIGVVLGFIIQKLKNRKATKV